jgi:hypothetical protein
MAFLSTEHVSKYFPLLEGRLGGLDARRVFVSSSTSICASTEANSSS